MRTSRRNLLSTVSGRAIHRGMRAPEGEQGGGGGGNDQGGGGNQGENQGGGGGGGNQQNNTGQDFKPTSFWEDPAEEAPKTPNQQGNQQQQQGNQNQNQGDDLGTAIANKVKTFTAPPVMTKEAMEGVAAGDYSKFEEGINTAIRGSMQETMGTVVNLLSKFGDHIEEKFGKLIESSHTNRDNRAFLREQIPASKNEGVQPIIDSLYDRALSLTKGDKTAAITMTKGMMKAMAEHSAPDLNLRIAPVGSDSDREPPAKVNWLEALNSPT